MGVALWAFFFLSSFFFVMGLRLECSWSDCRPIFVMFEFRRWMHCGDIRGYISRCVKLVYRVNK